MSPSVGHAAAESQGFKWESLMSAIDHPEVYDDLLDLLVESADVHRVLAFRLSSAKQARLDHLLDKNRVGIRRLPAIRAPGASPEGSIAAETEGMTTRPSAELRRRVIERAGNHCEDCRLHQDVAASVSKSLTTRGDTP